MGSERVTCGYCKDCEFWIEQKPITITYHRANKADPPQRIEPIRVGECRNPNVCSDGPFAIDNDHCIAYEYQEGGAQRTTAKFGCVNFEQSLTGDSN